MGIKYYKLFDLLNRRGMKKSDLRVILSSATIAKLSKGEHISGEAIEKICKFLKCQPGDIMEYVTDAYDVIASEDVLLADHSPLFDDEVSTLSNELNFYNKDSQEHYQSLFDDETS